MKKLLITIGIAIGLGGLIWLFCDKTEPLQAQYSNQTLKYIYSKSVTIVVDNANGYNTGIIPFTLSSSYGGFGTSWGSFAAYVAVDTLAKAGTSAQDSLDIYYKEIWSYTDATTYTTSDYDSTSLLSNFDWANGTSKKASLAPDVCLGFEFGVKHNSVVDDSIQVVITLLYQ